MSRNKHVKGNFLLRVPITDFSLSKKIMISGKKEYNTICIMQKSINYCPHTCFIFRARKQRKRIGKGNKIGK